jgi:hypothetical protein
MLNYTQVTVWKNSLARTNRVAAVQSGRIR